VTVTVTGATPAVPATGATPTVPSARWGRTEGRSGGVRPDLLRGGREGGVYVYNL
jgi:hypothetical protein